MNPLPDASIQAMAAHVEGVAVDDVVTARLVYDRALAAGAGTRLPL